jgi:ketosteroid isomerase-like protein
MHTVRTARRPLGAATLLLALLGSFGCTPPATEESAPAGDANADQRALVEAHQALVRAFEAGDAERFATLLSDEPPLLIFHPVLENRFDGKAEVLENLPRMMEKTAGATWSEYHPVAWVEGQVGWITSHLTLEAPGLPEPFVGRGTEIWTHASGSWKLVHAHWSYVPTSD